MVAPETDYVAVPSRTGSLAEPTALGTFAGIEAVVERLDIKRALYREIDEVRRSGSIVSSNTSTIPISLLVEGMPEAFQAEFAITHFFNPVRFMRLLEVVRGEHTKPEVIRCLENFNEERMGKGIVVCNDTPGFLGNRVGVFAIQTALHLAFEITLVVLGGPSGRDVPAGLDDLDHLSPSHRRPDNLAQAGGSVAM